MKLLEKSIRAVIGIFIDVSGREFQKEMKKISAMLIPALVLSFCVVVPLQTVSGYIEPATLTATLRPGESITETKTMTLYSDFWDVLYLLGWHVYPFSPYSLSLRAQGGYEAWLTDVSPPEHYPVLFYSYEEYVFGITITVPAGTPPGVYTFVIVQYLAIGVIGEELSGEYQTVTITVPPPTIESCDSGGNPQDTFNPGDDVYVTGAGTPGAFYMISVVEDTTWEDGMSIPPPVPGTTPVPVPTEPSGAFVPPPVCVWFAPLTPGSYDIVADLWGDGYYDAAVDLVDDVDVGTPGFFVIPEYPLGTILGLSMCLAALAVFKSKSLRIHL